MKQLTFVFLFSFSFSCLFGQDPFYETCEEALAASTFPWGYCDFVMNLQLDNAIDEAASGTASCPSCDQGCNLVVKDKWTKFKPVLVNGDDEITVTVIDISDDIRVELFDSCNGNVVYCGGVPTGFVEISGIISLNEYILRVWMLNGAPTGDVNICIGWSQTALPVELERFKGVQKDDKVELEWSTQSELNNSGFNILKSKDEKNWHPIGFVEGDGTSSDKNNYFFEDPSPFKGINYYQLEQVDFDGSKSYSEFIAVDFETLMFSVSPNPTADFIYIDGEANADYFLYDLKGRLLMSGVNDMGRIDLSVLTEGAYLLKIGNRMQRIIKE